MGAENQPLPDSAFSIDASATVAIPSPAQLRASNGAVVIPMEASPKLTAGDEAKQAKSKIDTLANSAIAASVAFALATIVTIAKNREITPITLTLGLATGLMGALIKNYQEINSAPKIENKNLSNETTANAIQKPPKAASRRH